MTPSAIFLQDSYTPLTRKQVDAFMTSNRVNLTETYIALLMQYNGGVFKQDTCCIIDGEEFQLRKIFGIATKPWETDDIATKINEFKRRKIPGVPVGGDYLGNLFCLKPSSNEIVFWDHESRAITSGTSLDRWLASFRRASWLQPLEETEPFRAVEKGDLDGVKNNVTERNINELWNHKRRTLLQTATKYHQREVVKLLIELGASVDSCELQGMRPLIWSATGGDADICRILIQAGADIELPSTDGESPLICAANAGHLTATVALIEMGANLTARNQRGLSLIDIAKLHHFDEAISAAVDFYRST